MRPISSYFITLALAGASLDTSAMAQSQGKFLEKDPYIGLSCDARKKAVLKILEGGLNFALQEMGTLPIGAGIGISLEPDDPTPKPLLASLQGDDKNPKALFASLQGKEPYIIYIGKFFHDGSSQDVSLESIGYPKSLGINKAIVEMYPNGKIGRSIECKE